MLPTFSANRLAGTSTTLLSDFWGWPVIIYHRPRAIPPDPNRVIE